MLAPPLCTTRERVDEAVDAVDDAIAAVFGHPDHRNGYEDPTSRLPEPEMSSHGRHVLQRPAAPSASWAPDRGDQPPDGAAGVTA